MTTVLHFQIWAEAPQTPAAIKAILEQLRYYDPAWLARQALPADPTLADIETLFDAFARQLPAQLGHMFMISWETLEWSEAPEADYVDATTTLELVGIVQWRSEMAAVGETWDESRRRKGGRGPINFAAATGGEAVQA